MKATTVKDPVCGMEMDTEFAADESQYKGQTYYFCSMSCKDKFDAKPEQFAAKAAMK